MLPLHGVKNWSPFKVDALGLVTLLGAEEVSTAVGALGHSPYTECLPLFGTYMIAANKFTRPIPGFALYNISDGVYIPILNGWFARWMIANLTNKITVLTCEPRLKKKSVVLNEISAVMIGLIVNGALIVAAALQADYYGIANSIAMAISVIVRMTMIHENRTHLNQLVDKYFRTVQSSDSSTTPAASEKAKAWVKIVITAPEDKVVIFKIRRGLIGCIVSDLDLVDKKTGEPEELILNKRQPVFWHGDDNNNASDADPELAQKHLPISLHRPRRVQGAAIPQKRLIDPTIHARETDWLNTAQRLQIT